MAFKGLTERFEAKSSEIYNQYSNKGIDGSGQPYLEIRPDDPSRNDVINDTRFNAAGSTSYRRDLRRVGSFLKSSDGLIFLLNQAELQTGNTFSESRVLNPLFVLGNIPGSIRIRRSLGSATGITVRDDNNQKSDGADSVVGSSGRLQKSTKDKIISQQINGRGTSNLLNLIPPNKITRAVSGVASLFGVGPDGILAVNDRPEIDFNGQFFSTALWRGFRSAGRTGNVLDTVGNQLQNGNFKAAVSTVRNGIERATRGTQTPSRTITGTDRGDKDDTSLNGWRYFIVDKNDSTQGIDRYISNVVSFKSVKSGVAGKDTVVPTVTMGEFNYKPKKLQGAGVTQKSAGNLLKDAGSSTSTPRTHSNKVITNIQKAATQKQNQDNGFWRKVSNVNTSKISVNNVISKIDKTIASVPADSNNNTGFGKMTYPDLSLQSRYNAMLDSLKEDSVSVDSSKRQLNEGFKKLKQERTFNLKMSGGFQAGDIIPDNIGELNIKYEGNGADRGKYLYDNSVSTIGEDGYKLSKGVNQPTDSEIKQIRDALGDTTDFIFYDYVNKRIIPFRAFLYDINESVTPTVSEQQYIGRIERNIIYTGVVRELSFVFRVQAFSVDEMKSVWGKINKVTGMTFPSKYVNGFMIPPLVKLTIGNLFVDQPGYVRSLSYKFDDDGWEIDENYQAPMGVTVNMSFSIIEKRQMSSSSKFYPYGDVRSPAPRPQSTPGTNIPSRSSNRSSTNIDINSPGKVSGNKSSELRGNTPVVTIDGKRATGPSVTRTNSARSTRPTRTSNKAPVRVAPRVQPRTPTNGPNVNGDRARVQIVDIGLPNN